MLIDTHCHLAMMIQRKTLTPYKEKELTDIELSQIKTILTQAAKQLVNTIVTIGTNHIENKNSIKIAQTYKEVYATIGIHPNDCTSSWKKNFGELKKLANEKEKNKIVGIGECGFDFHYPEFNIQQQKDLFKAQIELALEHDLALIIHSRDAAEETIRMLEEYKNDLPLGIWHCFSENQTIADYAIEYGFTLGIGGIVTYPKNSWLRDIVKNCNISNIVLETDAPFLPPQIARGKENHPKYINTIAHYIAELKETSFETIAQQTTLRAKEIFKI